MVQERIGQRYAKAIMELSIQNNLEKKVLEDMELFRTVCHENRDFVLMLKSPLIHTDKKWSVVKSIFQDKLDPMVLASFQLIVRKNRANVLTVIGDEFLKLYQKRNRILEVSIFSAAPLSAESRSQLLERVDKLVQAQEAGNGSVPSIKLIEKTDASLIGGFVLRVGDQMYDGSFSEALRRLSKEFNNNPYIKN